MAKYIDQNQSIPNVNSNASEVLSNPTNKPFPFELDKGNDFPSLVQNKPYFNDLGAVAQPPTRLVFNWQSKYVKKQSVGESNGKFLSHVILETSKNHSERRHIYKKPLIKNRSSLKYKRCRNNVVDQRVGVEGKYGKFKTANPFQLLSCDSDDDDSCNSETDVVSSSNDEFDMSPLIHKKQNRKRSHQKKRHSKHTETKGPETNHSVGIEKNPNKRSNSNEFCLSLSGSLKGETNREITIDISVVPSQTFNTLIFSDKRDKIPMSAIFRFVSEKTGISIHNMYFKKISGKHVEKKSFLGPDTQSLVMYFKLMGGGRRKKGDDHHPGKTCGPCVICGKSSNRYFHLVDRLNNESLQDHFRSLLPGISNNDCICKPCETNFKNKSKAKRSRTDHTNENAESLCHLAAYGLCKIKKYRCLQIKQKQLTELFELPIDQPILKEENISVNLCKQHCFQFFKSKNKCAICSKLFLPEQKKYYIPDTVIEFAELYMSSIPGSDGPSEGSLSVSSTVCSGCDYAVRKFMVDNFTSEGGKKSHDIPIENIKKIWSQFTSTESRSGISCCIVACCDAFLDHRPVLLSELFTIFLEKCSGSEKKNANQRILLQKIIETFEKSITVVTDDYKRMGTMLKRADNNDNKSLHTFIYNEFAKPDNKQVPASEINTNDTLLKAVKLLRNRLLAQKQMWNADSIDLENFDPFTFILQNCDPLLFNFISSLEGEAITDFVQDLKFENLKNTGLSCLNIISCILFSSDLACHSPFQMLISDVVDKYTNSSTDCLRILNQFGMCYSKPSLKRYQNSVIDRKREIGVQMSLDSFTICSVDNINKRSSYAAVKSSDTNRGFDGTSVQLVEPMPMSLKWSENELNPELSVCSTLIDSEGILYKKMKVQSDSLYRSIFSLCCSNFRLAKRDENGSIICSEIGAEEDKLSNIFESYVNNLVQYLVRSNDNFSVPCVSEENLYLAISYVTNTPIQVFQNGKNGQIEIIFQSAYQQMGHQKSSNILNILKDVTGGGISYSPIFTCRSYFNEDMLGGDFSSSLENIDLGADVISFHLFHTSAVLSCYSKLTSKQTKKSYRSSTLVQPNELAAEFSSLNLNLSSRRNLSFNNNAANFPEFEEVFGKSSNEVTLVSEFSNKAFSYCTQKHFFENNPSDNIHPNFIQYLDLESVSMREKSTVKFLYVMEENADNRETIKLTLDKLYSDLGIHKTLNYLVVVGDAKTYDHLVQLKNDFPEKLEWLLPFIGDWHTLKNYQLTLMKIYLDAGLRELIHVFHQGILAKVVSEATGFDKTHSFLMQCWEALYRFELQMFFLNQDEASLKDLSFDIEKVSQIVSSYTYSVNNKTNINQNNFGLESNDLGDLEEQFGIFCERLCSENKTWNLWHNFIHKDCLIYIMYFLALRTGNWNLRNLCVKHICRLTQVTDSRFYSRLLPQNMVDIHRFPRCVIEHFERGGFVMNISGRNNHSQGLDEGHESCINKDVKAALNTCSEQSISKAVSYVPTRANCLRKLKEAIGVSKSDLAVFSPSLALSHEENVVALKTCLGKSYLFAIHLDPLQNMQTDIVHHLFSLKVINQRQSEDLLSLADKGSQNLQRYIEKCKKMKAYALCSSTPLKLTGAFSKKVTVSSVKRELRDVQSQNKMFRIQIDWCAKNNLVMDDMKQYLNNPLPRAISTIDGLPYKSDKCKMLQIYKSRYPDSFESNFDLTLFDTVVLDGMFMIHSAPLRSFKTFSEYIFYLFTRHVSIYFEQDLKYVHVVFDDQNECQISPKSIERERRDIECDEKPIISMPDFSINDPLPRDWRKFLQTRDNKRILVNLISEQFLHFAQTLLLPDQTLFIGGGFNDSFIAKEVHCNEIKESENLHCNSLEGDSRVWLHAFTCQGLKCLIYSPNNDTYHIGMPLIGKFPEKSVYVALDSKFETLLNLNKLCNSIEYDVRFGRSSSDVLSVIQMLYVSTGCDYVSFFKDHGKKSFFDTFVKNSDFILADKGYTGTLNDFQVQIENGFLSFLRLVGSEYFKKCSHEFKDKCPDLKPESVFKSVSEENKTSLENHTQFINCLREALFKRCDEEHNIPNVEALHYHWLRSCWVCKVWSQADKNLVVYPPLEDFGWSINNDKLCFVWDTPENIQKVESRIKLWTEGCSCKTACLNLRCGCRKKKNFCSPGCKCGSNCQNFSFNLMGQSSEDLLSPQAGNNFTLNLNDNEIDRDELSDNDDLFPDC